jgi:penicillin-binding protein 1A
LDESLWPGTDVGFTIEVTHNMTVYNTITQQTRTHRDRRDVRSLEEAEAFIEEMKERVLTHADEVVAERTFKLPQPQGAFILIDHYTGHVLAMRGIRGEKQGNRAFNRATEATRSPGSQMKPLVPFAPLFELGLMQPSTVIDDIPFYLPNPGGRGWAPLNHWDSGRVFRGLTTARNAIYASGNVVSARAAADPRLDNHAGVPTMFRFLELMGISTLSPMDGPAIVLGGITRGTKLIELAGAYATIANHGEFNRPVLYTRVLDHEGNILLENPHNPQRVLAATTAYLLTHSMVDTVRIGTGPRVNWTPDSGLRGQIPIAGKTGTSQNNRDLGFVGYTPYFTAAFWIGNDNEQPLHRRTREFHLPMWRTIMQEVHLELDLPARSFTRPAGIVTARVCLDSGHLPTEYCRTDPRGDRTISEVFAAGLVPTHHCRVHQQHTYCTESGMLACENCPYWLVTTRVGLVRPMPIDDIEATVTDRHLEFPLGVRQGLTCAYHVAGGFFAGPSNPWLWDFETGQWVPNPNCNPDTQTQEPADDEDYDALPPGMDFTPAVPEAPGNDIPPEWPGLGAPPAVTNEDDEDSDPFVTTVTIPGPN